MKGKSIETCTIREYWHPCGGNLHECSRIPAAGRTSQHYARLTPVRSGRKKIRISHKMCKMAVPAAQSCTSAREWMARDLASCAKSSAKNPDCAQNVQNGNSGGAILHIGQGVAGSRPRFMCEIPRKKSVFRTKCAKWRLRQRNLAHRVPARRLPKSGSAARRPPKSGLAASCRPTLAQAIKKPGAFTLRAVVFRRRTSR